MHTEAFEWVKDAASRLPDVRTVIEIGSRNVNGTVRTLFPGRSWFGLDIEDGPDVDLVVDAMEFTPAELVDMVICCEVLEHAPRWKEIILRAVSWLNPGGVLLITVAGPGRDPHSAYDGGPLKHGEYYGNVSPEDLGRVAAAAGLAGMTVSTGKMVDVYYQGWKQ